MQQKFIINQQRPCLLLFFAGWGMDENPFRHYCPEESDFMICYDYRTLDFDVTLIHDYKAIHLIAWSMGVWAASQVMQKLQYGTHNEHTLLPITQSLAINGTPYPVDETRGISPTLFQSTLDGLNEDSLLKFYRRMCGGKAECELFLRTAPQRPIEELKEELEAIGLQQQLLPLPGRTFDWREVFIGKGDRIFPPAHQHNAWEEHCMSIEKGNEAHYDRELFQLYLEECE